MPSERFYKLPEEKQRRIYEAAMREFCSAAMEDVSINRIVREAEISRGSFYTYFADKQDVLQFLVQDARRKQYAYAKDCLIEANGDFWKAAEKILQFEIEFFSRYHLFDVSKKLAIRSGFDPFNAVRKCREDVSAGSLSEADFEDEEMTDWLLEHMDCSSFRSSDRRTIRALLIECRVLLMLTVAKVMLFPEQREETMETYHAMIEILQEGINKR